MDQSQLPTNLLKLMETEKRNLLQRMNRFIYLRTCPNGKYPNFRYSFHFMDWPLGSGTQTQNHEKGKAGDKNTP